MEGRRAIGELYFSKVSPLGARARFDAAGVPDFSPSGRRQSSRRTRPKGKPFSMVLLIRARLGTPCASHWPSFSGEQRDRRRRRDGRSLARVFFFLSFFLFFFHDAAAVICHVVGGERLRCICDFTRVLRSPSPPPCCRRRRGRPPNLLAYKFRRRLSLSLSTSFSWLTRFLSGLASGTVLPTL